MITKDKLIRIGAVCLFWTFLTGCSLFGRNKSLVGQGVAFPQPGEGPPTSESALPQPVVLAKIDPIVTAEPTATIQQAPPPTNTAASLPQPTQLSPIISQPIIAPTTKPPTLTPPQIISFSAEAVDIDGGKQITFQWESSGATSARIYNWANGSMRFQAFWDVATSGILTVELADTRRRDPHFDLFIYQGDDVNPADTRSVQIPWACSLDYFFEPESNICPRTGPTYTTAVAQRFQGGQMIWLEALGYVYVLYDDVYPGGSQGGDLQWERFNVNWAEASADDLVEAPPPGYYNPAGGFHKVMVDHPAVQERLGLGLAPEEEYDGAWQLQPSDTDVLGDGAVFLRLETGQVARLSGFDTWGWLWEAF